MPALVQSYSADAALAKANIIELHPIITGRIATKDFASAMERLKTGEASKILMCPAEGNKAK